MGGTRFGDEAQKSFLSFRAKLMNLHPQVEYRTVRIDANTTAFEVFFIGGRDCGDYGDQMLLMMIMVNMVVILILMMMLTFDTL